MDILGAGQSIACAEAESESHGRVELSGTIARSGIDCREQIGGL